MSQENFKPVLENGNTDVTLSPEQIRTHPAAIAASSVLALARNFAARS